MPFINCPDCGKLNSIKLDKCPKCGTSLAVARQPEKPYEYPGYQNNPTVAPNAWEPQQSAPWGQSQPAPWGQQPQQPPQQTAWGQQPQQQPAWGQQQPQQTPWGQPAPTQQTSPWGQQTQPGQPTQPVGRDNSAPRHYEWGTPPPPPVQSNPWGGQATPPPTPAYCQRCGTQLAPDARMCHNCGQPVAQQPAGIPTRKNPYYL